MRRDKPMSYPASVSKTSIQFSLLLSAIAGSLLAVSSLPGSASSTKLQQLGSSSAETPAEVNRVAVLAIALGGSAAIGLGLSAVVDRQRRSQPSRPARSNDVSLDRVSRPLRQKLVRSLHDDQATATRLFTQAQFKYPGKTPDWYAEKVIYDLERDRRK